MQNNVVAVVNPSILSLIFQMVPAPTNPIPVIPAYIKRDIFKTLFSPKTILSNSKVNMAIRQLPNANKEKVLDPPALSLFFLSNPIKNPITEDNNNFSVISI